MDLARNTEKALKYLYAFVEVAGARDPWDVRFAKKFGHVYAAAALGVDFGIMPFTTKKHALRSILTLHDKARIEARSIADATAALLSTLVEGTKDGRFPVVPKGEHIFEEPEEAFWGARITRGGHDRIAVIPATLNELIEPRRHQTAVRNELLARQILLPGQRGRYVDQVQIGGLAPVREHFYILDAVKVLPPHMMEAAGARRTRRRKRKAKAR